VARAQAAGAGEAYAGSRTWTPGLRGFVGGLATLLAGGAMGLWMATTPQLRALGRGLALDPQAVMVLAAIVVAFVALLLAWSAFGRAMVVVTGLVLAGQGLLATVMALGGLGITGRPGAPTSLSVWPILGALLGTTGAVVVLWRTQEEATIRRRQLLGSGAATLLAIAAVGVPTLPLSVAGPAPAPAMTTAGPFVAQGVVGLLVVLLATAGFRRRRAAAMGQAVAAIGLLGADVWWQTLAPATGTLTRDQGIAALLAVAALATWAITSGAGRPEPEVSAARTDRSAPAVVDAVDLDARDRDARDFDARDFDARDRGVGDTRPRASGARTGRVRRDDTLVHDDALVRGDPPARDDTLVLGEDPHPTDPTEVVDVWGLRDGGR
jgi:hypothetical protein